MSSENNSPARKVLLSGLIGNVMEGYDFTVFGYFAAIIGSQFFPTKSATSSLLIAFAAFAIGYLVRPFGGILFGRIADKTGRRRAMVLSVVAMTVPTVLMALLPTKAQIGIVAPIAVVLLRIIQGLAAGGEYTTAIVFLAENAPPKRRGFFAIWGLWGSVLGMLMASGFGAFLAKALTSEQLETWGWRIPFAIGALIALAGVLVRNGMSEDNLQSKVKSPIRLTFGRYRLDVLRVIGINIASSVAYFSAFVYAVSYIEDIDKLEVSTALTLNNQAMCLLLLLYPLAALVSDYIGRKPMLLSGAALLCIGGLPIFQLMHSQDPQLILRGEIALTVAVALLAGGKNPANVELMPAAIRCTGLAVAFNIAEGCFGGTTPFISAWLISETGNPLLPGAWVALSGLVTLLTVLFFTQETAFKALASNGDQTNH